MSGAVGVAILGCAHQPHAWSYARALSAMPDARLVGLYDADPDLGHSVADHVDACYTDDVDELVASPDVDAVVVCSPTSQHRADVELAASHGLHVLCEKPIATTLEDANAMLAATREAGTQLQLAFVARFLPHVRRVKQALDGRTLGDLVGIRAGNRGRPPLPPQFPAWFTDPDRSGGGALIDHSVHLTDLLRHLTGQEVSEVAAEAGSLLWDAGVEDCALLSLRLDGGTVASIDPSWSVPADNPWDYDFCLHLIGTTGAVDLDDVSESVQLVSSHGDEGMRLVGFGDDPDASMVEAFVASVAGGVVLEPCATGVDGVRSLEVALAGYASASNGASFVPVRP